MTPPPLAYRWTGVAMLPLNQRASGLMFTVGRIYRLENIEDRSRATHNHFFACVADAFGNLPESLAERFQSPDALRKYALIRCGFRDERSIVCASKAEAQRVAAFVRPMDDFAVVSVAEAAVVVWTAKSQSMRAMGKRDFAASKTAVLDYLASMIGASPAALATNAQEKAA